MKNVKIQLRQDGETGEFVITRFSNTIQLSIGMRVPVHRVEEWCAMPRVQIDVVGTVETGDETDLPLLCDALPKQIAAPEIPSGDDVSGNVFEMAREFDALMMDNAAENRWIEGQNFDDAMMPDMGANNLGSMGIQAAIRRNKAIAICRRNCAKDLEIDADKIGGCKYRAQHLAALKSFCGELQPF